MSNLMNAPAFSAGIKRLENTPKTLDAMVRYACFEGAKSQLSPANRLIAAIDAGGVTKGDIAKAAFAMLADGLGEFSVLNASGYKGRKGAEYLGSDASETAAIALKGIGARMVEFTEARAAAKAKTADTKKTKTTEVDADAPQENADGSPVHVQSPLGAALIVLGRMAQVEGEKAATRERTALQCAADALVRELNGSPSLMALFDAASLAISAARVQASADADTLSHDAAQKSLFMAEKAEADALAQAAADAITQAAADAIASKQAAADALATAKAPKAKGKKAPTLVSFADLGARSLAHA